MANDRVSMLAALVALATIGASGSSSASRRDWVGSAACGTCHPRELAAWQTTPHATTRDRFATRPPARCLGCHGTGEAPAGPSIAVEVGCEACHGAGAAYSGDDVMRDRPVAVALGLAELDTAKQRASLCSTCHARATRGRAFDPSAAVHSLGNPSESKP